MCCAVLIGGCTKKLIRSDNADARTFYKPFSLSTTTADGKTNEISAAAVIRSIAAHGAPRKEELLSNLQPSGHPIQGKDISWLVTLEHQGKTYWVMVFNPLLQSWPGSQPITIVVADSELKVQCWIESGGSPMFRQASLRRGENEAELTVLSRNRHGGTWVDAFSISKTNITKVSSTLDYNLSTGDW